MFEISFLSVAANYQIAGATPAIYTMYGVGEVCCSALLISVS